MIDKLAINGFYYITTTTGSKYYLHVKEINGKSIGGHFISNEQSLEGLHCLDIGAIITAVKISDEITLGELS